MLPFAECCVLIPCSTVEDFPTRLSPEDARGLLGCLTAAWHPRLIASTGRVPSWRRADTWPVSFTLPTPAQLPDASCTLEQHQEKSVIPTRLILIPDVSAAKLPADIRSQLGPDTVLDAADLGVLSDLMVGDRPRRDVLIRASNRTSAISAIERWADSQTKDVPAVSDDANDWLSLERNLFFGSSVEGQKAVLGRTVDAHDFFALGYTWWQIQILTRRLRYTSNLDIGHFEKRVVAAAVAFCEGDAAETAEGLHDAFDALAEERDHYFSSDPSLVDLFLTTPSTFGPFLDLAETVPDSVGDDSVLATPSNVLVDETVAQWMLNDSAMIERFQSILSRPDWGWAGGGPGEDVHFDLMSIEQCEAALSRSFTVAQQVAGRPVAVYSRLSGLTPPELITALVSEKVVGMIPLSFVDGRGSGDDSKVILSSGGHEIEALTARPIDAANDADFLNLGVRLGEAIDSGEVATGLFVHWPGGGCDSFTDVRRAATWTLALGRFWTLDKYFSEGEHPYHQGEATAFTDSVATIQGDSRAVGISDWNTALEQQRSRNAAGLLSLIASPPTVSASREIAFASALGLPAKSSHGNSTGIADGVLVVNPNSAPVRSTASITGRLRKRESFVFHVASRRAHSRLVVDVPAFGFSCVSSKPNMFAKPAIGPEAISDAGPIAASDSRFARFIAKLAVAWGRRSSGPSLVRPKKTGDPIRLSNEFLEVSIDAKHGGVAGVYSGASRGNRFSSRLAVTPASAKEPCMAKVVSWEVRNHEGNARVILQGTLGADPTWHWRSEYELLRGRRTVRWQISFRGEHKYSPSWNNHPILRVAIADSIPIVRAVLREKMHRTSNKFFVAPGGYLLEEDQRSTLVATDGQSLHRRVGDRFFDSMLRLDPQQTVDADGWSIVANMDFGFDLPRPMSEALKCSEHSVIAPIDFSSSSQPLPMSPRGWLMHAVPNTVNVQFVESAQLENGQRLVHLRLIQTRSKSTKSVIRFCRRVESAARLNPLRRPLAGNSLVEGMLAGGHRILSDIRDAEVTGEIICRDDAIELTMPAHGIVHVLVRFANEKN